MDKHTLVTLRGAAAEIKDTCDKLRTAVEQQSECMKIVGKALQSVAPGSKAEEVIGDLYRRRMCVTGIDMLALQAELLEEMCSKTLDKRSDPSVIAVISRLPSDRQPVNLEAMEVVA